jgi:hypothetical protein
VIEVLRGRQRLAALSSTARPGRNTVRLPGRLPASGRVAQRQRSRPLAPGRYSLRLTVTSADGQTATDTAPLTVTRPRRRR